MTPGLPPLRRRLILTGVRLVLSIFAALAVLLTPIGMTNDGAAMAATHEMAGSSAMEHCSDRPGRGKEQPPESCCIVACSTLPADPPSLTSYSPLPLRPSSAQPADRHGLSAEAATPPPRSS